MRAWVLTWTAVALLLGRQADAQPRSARPSATPAAIAFLDVNVIRMEGERVEPGQAVLVEGERIVAIGEPRAIAIPAGALVIDAKGRYLLPGLTDAHVHLTTDMPWAPTRPAFGDGPLYLAHGITTVINLRGLPEQLEWRRRIEARELVGPTIYTSGEFVNEPRVNTAAEVRAEIDAQRRAGYDLIKFHEILGGDVTTSGLTAAAYRQMNDAARDAGMPLVGHAPVKLGVDALLAARQPLAHLGTLTNVYFLPLAANGIWLLSTVVSILVLTALAVGGGAPAILRRWRAAPSQPSPRMSRLRVFIGAQSLLCAFMAIAAALFLPGGALFESVGLRRVFTALALIMVAGAAALLVPALAVLRDRTARPGARIYAASGLAASMTLLLAILAFWLPVAWRSSERGIDDLARRLRDAKVPVQTTLVVYDSIGGRGWRALANDPVIAHLSADTRDIWRRVAQSGPPGVAHWYADFMKAVARRLHHAGVTLMAGTDAMGIPLVAPGSSLHRELELLIASGLTPYETIRAATIVPATFLGRDTEFSTIAPGKRADLILVDGNPLEDVSRLRRPAGVMARGRWFTRDDLDRMLTALADNP